MNINILIKTPLKFSSRNVNVAHAIYPNYLQGGFSIDPSLLLKSKRDLVRTVNYRFKSLDIYIPGVFSVAITYPYKTSFWGAHLAIPLGKFGFEYETERIENWSIEDENNELIPQEEIEKESLFKQARSRFTFGMSYGETVPEYSNFNWNISLSLLVMDILDKHNDGSEDVSEIYFIPFLATNASVDVVDNLKLFVQLKLPEITVIKTGLNYSF